MLAVSYTHLIQRAGEAVYSEAGKAQTKEQIAYYMNNAKEIRNALSGMGYTVFGGVNAPYIWLQTPDGMKSWDFFDMLLELSLIHIWRNICDDS